MHFQSIDIDRVLIETTTSNIVLTAHLIVLTHACKGDEQTFYAATCGIRHEPRGADIHAIHGVRLTLDSTNGDLVQQFFVGG